MNMDAKAYSLLVLLKEISSCCQVREEIQAKNYDLTVAEARCLMIINIDGCGTSTELAERMQVAKSRITRILDGLAKKKLISRNENAADRRVIRIQLTNKGAAIARELTLNVLALHRQVLEELDIQRVNEIIGSLTDIREAMNSVKSRLERGEFKTA